MLTHQFTRVRLTCRSEDQLLAVYVNEVTALVWAKYPVLFAQQAINRIL